MRIEQNGNYKTIRSNGLKRMTDFHTEAIDEKAEYLLAFESDEVAYRIPGTTDDFVLARYKQELGREYKNSTLYLISQNDKMLLKRIKINLFQPELEEEIQNSSSDDLESYLKAHKISKPSTSNDSAAEVVGSKVKHSLPIINEDEYYAESLQALFDGEGLLPSLTESNIDQLLPPSSLELIIEDLSKRVFQDEQFLFECQT